MPGALICGVSGAGKSHLYRTLVATCAAQGREILLSFPQAMSTTAHIHLGGNPQAQRAHVVDWCESLVAFAERVHHQAIDGGLVSRRENYPFNWMPMLLLEGFTFDIALWFGIARDVLIPFEHRLAKLGVFLVILYVPEREILAQCVRSTRRHRGPGWSKYLSSLGQSDRERAHHFERQQGLLFAWAAESPMRALPITTITQDWHGYASRLVSAIEEQAQQFYEQSL